MFPKINKFSYIQEFCPLLALWPDDKTTVSKGGQFSRVVELTGKSYTGPSPDVTEGLYHGRKGFFEGLPSGITVMHQSHRQRLSKQGGTGKSMMLRSRRVVTFKSSGGLRDKINGRD